MLKYRYYRDTVRTDGIILTRDKCKSSKLVWLARQSVQRGQDPVTGALKERVNSMGRDVKRESTSCKKRDKYQVSTLGADQIVVVLKPL